MCFRRLLPFILATVWGCPAHSQEIGPLQSYGSGGKLFSSGKDAHYLLTRQSYASEDSFGYQGQIRIVKKYEGGAYEEAIKEYFARCFGIDQPNEGREVMLGETGKQESFASVPITPPNRLSGQRHVVEYNLYWAACKGEFLKFK